MTSSLKRSLVLFLACVSFSGCALTPQQRAGVEKFALSASAVGKVAGDEFRQTRRRIEEVNKMSVLLGDLSPVDELDGGVTPDDARVRIATAEALEHYGDLLHELVTSDDGAKIDATVTQLNETLRSVPNLNLTEKEYSAVGSLVGTVGKWFVGWKRASAVREAVEKTGPVAVKVAKQLERSFDRQDPRWLAPLYTAMKGLKARLAFWQAPANAGSVTPQIRDDVAGATVVYTDTQAEYASTSDQIVKSARLVDSAHTDLEALLNNKTERIAALNNFSAEATTLITLVKSFKEK